MSEEIPVEAGPAPFAFLKPKPASSSVTVTNTGVLSIIAGAGVAVDQPTGDVTVSASGSGGPPDLWNHAAYLLNDFTVTGGPLAVGPTIGLNTAGYYLVCLTASAPRCTFWLQFESDPFGPASALVSGVSSAATDGTSGSLGLSKVIYANSNNKILLMVASMVGIGGNATVSANAPPAASSGAPNASGISAVQLSQVS